jgi:hypothetical protein
MYTGSKPEGVLDGTGRRPGRRDPWASTPGRLDTGVASTQGYDPAAPDRAFWWRLGGHKGLPTRVREDTVMDEVFPGLRVGAVNAPRYAVRSQAATLPPVRELP